MPYKSFLTVEFLSCILQGCLTGEIDVMFPQSKVVEAPSFKVRLIRNANTPRDKYVSLPEIEGKLWAEICAPLLAQTDKWLVVLQTQTYLTTLNEQVTLDLRERLVGSSWAYLLN